MFVLGREPPPASALSGNMPLQTMTLPKSGADAARGERKKKRTGHTPSLKRDLQWEGRTDNQAGPVDQQQQQLQPQARMAVARAAAGVNLHQEGNESGALVETGSEAILGSDEEGGPATQVRMPGTDSRAEVVTDHGACNPTLSEHAACASNIMLELMFGSEARCIALCVTRGQRLGQDAGYQHADVLIRSLLWKIYHRDRFYIKIFVTGSMVLA